VARTASGTLCCARCFLTTFAFGPFENNAVASEQIHGNYTSSKNYLVLPISGRHHDLSRKGMLVRRLSADGGKKLMTSPAPF